MKKLYLLSLLCAVTLFWSCSSDSDIDDPVVEDHEAVTLRLKDMLDSDPWLKGLVEKDLAIGKEINPDKNYNPAQDLESLYDFMDWSTTCMPWECLGKNDYEGIYNRIDQSTGYFWFIFDQPLDELKNMGYYYPTLNYQEPLASWIKDYSKTWGAFLDTSESWNDEYLANVQSDPNFQLQEGIYEDPSNWHSFNEFFARKYKDIDQTCPVGDADVVMPAESWFKGTWEIDETSHLVKGSVPLKSAWLNDVSQLVGANSKFADSFAGGTFTHMFLDLNCYHRFNSPVSGTIIDIEKIDGVNAGGGITEWDAENKRYVYYNETGFQMIETRARVIIQTEDYGLVAMMPIGMSQICSIMFDSNLKVGDHINKGDEMGYLKFGGSDVCLLFQKGVKIDTAYPEPDPEGGYQLSKVRSNLFSISRTAD